MRAPNLWKRGTVPHTEGTVVKSSYTKSNVGSRTVRLYKRHSSSQNTHDPRTLLSAIGGCRNNYGSVFQTTNIFRKDLTQERTQLKF